jgi:hypothetical protein
MPSKICGVPKFVVVTFGGRHLFEKPARFTNNPLHAHFDEDLAIA